MCCINGYNFKDHELIQKMNEVTRHRGPDDTGIFVDEMVTLGHNRLSIIDLSKDASQPMKCSEDKLIIVFNGEIYNYKELKKELEAEYPFKTQSDTEVILGAYKKWGGECVKRFNGIFAFAIWDRDRKEIFMARDHVGVKPFYYYHNSSDGKFIFSSEIKAILEHHIPRTLDREAFNHYLKILYTPEPYTMFKDIHKLPHAHYAVFKDNRIDVTRYWEARPVELADASKSELVAAVRDRVQQSIESQLISDRPVGVYLSGGIDSSVVLHSVAQSGKLRNKKINTFSVGYELYEKEESKKFNNDFEYARRTAKHYSTNHHEIQVRCQDVVDNFEKAVWHMDEPISHPTAVPMLLLAEMAKKDVAVVLGGDGGDELFGGDERYRLSRIADIYKKLPGFVRLLLNRHSKIRKLDIPSGIDRYELLWFNKFNLSDIINSKYLNDDITRDFFAGHIERYINQSFEKTLMDMERESWLVDYSLTLTDKMTMASGLEARVPLLDKELVALSLAVPMRYKVGRARKSDKKIILRDAFRGQLPDYLFKKPKSGWISPGAKWLRRQEFSKFAQSILSAEYYSQTENMFHWDAVKKILGGHIHGGTYNLITLWALLTFQIWARKFAIKIN